MAVFGSPRQTLEALIQEQQHGFQLSKPHLELLLEVVLGVVGYREEGSGKAPDVFLLLNLGEIESHLKGADPISIGQGPFQSLTVKKALKSCGPLTRDRDWAVYMLLEPSRIQYGIFRNAPVPLSEPSFHRLRTLGSPSPLLIGVQRSGESVVEIRSSGGPVIYFDTSGKKEKRDYPALLVQSITKAMTRDVPPPIRSRLRRFYEKIMEDLFTGPHGSLIAVLEAGHPPPDLLRDGIHLHPPLDTSSVLRTHLKKKTAESTSALFAHSNLIRNMLETDGVTIFDTRARIISYHAFVLDPGVSVSHLDLTGGARSRAYVRMKSALGNRLHAVLYKSQDGDGEFEVHHASG
jgi:hypothetical protein